jgi:hypothetical protein
MGRVGVDMGQEYLDEMFFWEVDAEDEHLKLLVESQLRYMGIYLPF